MSLAPCASLNAFEPYVASLERLVCKAMISGLDLTERIIVGAALDGQPGGELRNVVPINVRREIGAFFTSASLAERVATPEIMTAPLDSIFVDPACGVGDLLVASARCLPVAHDLSATLAEWGDRLYGFDLCPEFIRAAKARLALLAIERGVPLGITPMPPLARLFPNIQVDDGLTKLSPIAETGKRVHILLNPPYPKIPTPANCEWARGRVSAAAIFLEACVAKSRQDTQIAAILPDVLRTGSFYKKWRKAIEESAKIKDIEIVGLFDKFADVDVFIVRLITGGQMNRKPANWWKPAGQGGRERIGDHFDVHVGPVVPHRDPGLGQWHPYIHVRMLPIWETFDADTAPRRRFRGNAFTPPFVAVRRTSAPGDKNRAVASLVTGDSPVAVENHLIVLKPRRNSLSLCRQLLRSLQSKQTDEWLDERIRCRHLTVSALRDLPWRRK